MGGARAITLASEAWRGDRSYQVRAAALLAMVKLGAPGAREAVLAALSTPSYRDAIQNAAIALVVQRPDSELVTVLSRELGAQPVPALALTALTARGNAAARAALVRALDDGRSWVREWVLDAVTDQLDAPVAVALLREATPGLRSPAARTDVNAALDRLERSPS